MLQALSRVFVEQIEEVPLQPVSDSEYFAVWEQWRRFYDELSYQAGIRPKMFGSRLQKRVLEGGPKSLYDIDVQHYDSEREAVVQLISREDIIGFRLFDSVRSIKFDQDFRPRDTELEDELRHCQDVLGYLQISFRRENMDYQLSFARHDGGLSAFHYRVWKDHSQIVGNSIRAPWF